MDPYRSKRWKRRLLTPIFSIYTKPEHWLYLQQILSPRSLTLPDFLGLGAPQSGTTWLYENLRCHPEICLSEEKELRYFSLKIFKSLRFSYAAQFKHAGTRKKGEISPDYAILPRKRIEFIRSIMPEARLLFIMRNPIDRVWSAARRVLSRLPGRKFEELTEEELNTYFRSAHCRQMSDYTTVFAHWLSVFPAEQLHIAVFDEIASRPKEVLTEMFRHIGVSENVDWRLFPCDKVVNKNPEAVIPEKSRRFLEEMYRPQIEVLYQRFGSRLAGWRR